LEQLDGREVVPALLLERAAADLVGIDNAVVALIAGRFWFGRQRFFGVSDGVRFYSSGGRNR
jgi:hypothetical protein